MSFSFDINSVANGKGVTPSTDLGNDQFAEFLDESLEHIARNREAFERQQADRQGLPSPFGSEGTYLSTAMFAQLVDDLDLYDALGVLGSDQGKLEVYLRAYHPNLKQEVVTTVSKLVVEHISGQFQFEKLMPYFKRTLMKPSINISQDESRQNLYIVEGQAEGADRILCTGPFSIQIKVDEEGYFKGSLFLPYAFSENEVTEQTILINSLSMATRERSEIAIVSLSSPVLDAVEGQSGGEIIDALRAAQLNSRMDDSTTR